MKTTKRYDIWLIKKHWYMLQDVLKKYNCEDEPKSMKVYGWIDEGIKIYNQLNYSCRTEIKTLIFNTNLNKNERIKFRIFEPTREHLLEFKKIHKLSTIQKAINLAIVTIVFLDKKGINLSNSKFDWKSLK